MKRRSHLSVSNLGSSRRPPYCQDLRDRRRPVGWLLPCQSRRPRRYGDGRSGVADDFRAVHDGSMPSQRSSYADIQGGKDQDVGADRRPQAPNARSDVSLAAAHLRFLRSERRSPASCRAEHRRPRVHGDDAALLSREYCGAEKRGGGDSNAVKMINER